MTTSLPSDNFAIEKAWNDSGQHADLEAPPTTRSAIRVSNSALPRDHDAPSARPNPATPSFSLRELLCTYRWRVAATYALFNLENLLRLVQPFVLGVAINDLLNHSYFGLWLFVVQHLSHLAIGSLRQVYDTRVFSSIYTDLAASLVADQRGRDVDVSRVAARSALSREYVEFLEHSMPMLIRAVYSILGALVLLAFYDSPLVPLCLALLVPAVAVNRVYARRTRQLSSHLHDEFENEVDTIAANDAAGVRQHYTNVARWRIKLSDCEALNFGIMELFVLGVLVGTLVRACSLPSAHAGDIFAVFRYVLMLIMGLDSVPKLVQQVSRLRDIQSRIQPERSQS